MNGDVLGLLQQSVELQRAMLEVQKRVSHPVAKEDAKEAESPEKRGVPEAFRGTLSGTPKAVKNKAKTPADIVRAHLKKHPEDRAKSTRQLAARLKVSKSTVDRVLKE